MDFAFSTEWIVLCLRIILLRKVYLKSSITHLGRLYWCMLGIDLFYPSALVADAIKTPSDAHGRDGGQKQNREPNITAGPVPWCFGCKIDVGTNSITEIAERICSAISMLYFQDTARLFAFHRISVTRD